jgi:hypothetical protein
MNHLNGSVGILLAAFIRFIFTSKKMIGGFKCLSFFYVERILQMD